MRIHSNYVYGRKFNDKAEALKCAKTNLRKRPQFDWYVVESADGPCYVYRGGARPTLFGSNKFIFINGVLETPQGL